MTSYSTSVVVIALIVGLAVGGASVFAGLHSSSPSVTATVTVTNVSTMTVTSISSGGSTGLTLAQFQSALGATKTVNLTVSSYDFGKGSLGIFTVNSGASPIVLSPADVIYNGSSTGASIEFAFIDNSVTQVGVYAYIPAGSRLFISATPNPTPLSGQKATLEILNEMLNFTYGTQSG